MTRHFALTAILSLSMTCLPAASAHPEEADSVASSSKSKSSWTSRLHVGGYGEVAMTRNFYSDSYLRYVTPENYRDARSNGRFDIPHAVIFIGYDFGKGWSMSSEIEFEHGGTESAVEFENEEGASMRARSSAAARSPLSSSGFRSHSCPSLTSGPV